MPRVLSGDWLQQYEKYVDGTESPKDYNFWSGISILSASLKRAVCLPTGQYDLYPNQYIILVGPPGVGKGTAITPAVGIAKKADTVNYLSDRITAERVIEKLATGFQKMSINTAKGTVSPVNESSATIISKELPVFIGASDWMLPLLCQLWDENAFEYETKNKGSSHIENLCVGLIAGCVPDYIRRINKDATTAISGGFTARCIFVYATEKSCNIAWPIKASIHQQLEQDLVTDLRHIAALSGEMTPSQGAKNYFTTWFNKQTIDRFEQEVVANFKSRMPAHIKKLAMTLSVSESDSLIIEERHMKKAIDEIEKVGKNLAVTFRSVGESSLVVATAKVCDYIAMKGECSRAEISKHTMRDVTDDDLTRILSQLTQQSAVDESSRNGRLWYKNITLIAP